MSEPYCDRCMDTGLVIVERIGIQPEALRCSCYLVNPVIQERHRHLDTSKTKRVGGGAMGPQSRFSLQRVVGRTDCQIFEMVPGGGGPPPSWLPW